MILIFSTKSEIVSRISASISENYSVAESTAQLIRDVRRKTSAQLVVIGEDVPEFDALEAAREIQFIDSSLGLLLLRSRVDLGITTSAMAAGIRAVLSYSEVSGLAEKATELISLTRAMRNRGSEVSETDKAGTLVVCYSPKGGVGKTTTALNIAGAISSGGLGTVVVVDLDLQFGDVGVAAGITARDSSISDLVSLEGALESKSVKSVLKEVATGFSILTAPSDPAEANSVTPELISQSLRVLSAEFDWIIVDSPPAFTDGILSAFDLSDVQIMITTSDLASIKNLDIACKTLKKIGLDGPPRLAIVNRFDPKISDRTQISVAAREVASATDAIVIQENSLISQSSSRGYVSTVGREAKKMVKVYQPVIDFLVTHRSDSQRG